MKTPNNRREFERHINMLSESISRGAFKLPPSRRIIRSLLNMKKLPNNRVNFLTIDESARLMANSLANFSKYNFEEKSDAKE